MKRNKVKDSRVKFKKYYIPFLIFFVTFLLVDFRTTINPGDDIVFKEAFRNYGGIKGWLNNYTSTWSGRILPHFLLILFLNVNLFFWRVANAIVFLVLSIGIYAMSVNSNNEFSEKKKTVIATLICGAILFIPSAVIYTGGIWITGSFTYLWPVAFALIAMIPFKRLVTGENNNKFLIVIGAFSAIFSSYSEQSAVVLLAFSGLTIAYSLTTKNKAKVYHYILFILTAVNSYISLSAPGNKVRTTAETLRWYSDYDMLSVIDKLFLGANLTFAHIFEQSNLLILILGSLLLILTSKKTNDIFTNILATVPLIFVAFRLIINTKIFDIERIDRLNAGDLFQYIYIFIGIVVCLIILYLFFIAFEKYQIAIIAFLLFSAGLCSVLVLGFSPTMYASSNRIFFIPDIFILIAILLLCNQYLEKEKECNNTSRLAFITFAGISIVMAIYFVAKVATTFQV